MSVRRFLLVTVLAFGFLANNCLAAPAPPTMSLSTNGLQVTVSWTPVDGATGYTLLYAPVPYAGPSTIQSKDMGLKTSFYANLWEGASYYVATQAYNAQGESSPYSNIEKFTMTGNRYPTGDYLGVTYQDESGSGESAITSISTDGDSSVYLELLYSSSGDAGETGIGLMDLHDDGTYTLGRGYFGYISQDQNMLVHADTDPTDGDINITVNVRKSTNMTGASLAGEYFVMDYHDDVWTAIGQLTCGGTGSCQNQDLEKSDREPLDSGTIPVHVNSDGTVIFGNISDAYGILHPDKDFMVLAAGADPSEDYQGMVVALRKSSSLNNTNLNGKFVVIEYNSAPEVNYLVLNFDGEGHVAYERTHSSTGFLGNGSTTYNVNADGSLIIPAIQGKTMKGAVSPDGRKFACVNTSGNSLGIMVGIK